MYSGKSAFSQLMEFLPMHEFRKEKGKNFSLLSKNFILSAFVIAELYKCRWRAELFFKWIKQRLRIKAFYGTSENSVKTQIWIAISVYVVVAIIKKPMSLYALSLYTTLQILSVNLFVKIPLIQLFNDSKYTMINQQSGNRLKLSQC